MLSPLGAPVIVYVHGAFGQVDGTVQFTAAPTVVVWFVGVTVGGALTVQVNTADVPVTLAASVMRKVTLLYVWAAPPTVPVMTLVGLTLSPGGPLIKAMVHGPFGQFSVRPATLTVAPTVVTWLASALTVGRALTIQLNVPVVAVALAASVIVILTEPKFCAELVIVPVMSPLLLMVRVAGPPVML
jgi:hypothetical protein